MQEVISNLVKLQSLDKRIAEINSIVSNIPEKMLKVKEKLDKALIGFQSVKVALDNNKEEYLTLERDISEKKELLSNSQQKLMQVQNNKEYQSVLRELDTLKKIVEEGDKKLTEMLSSNFSYESEMASITELKNSLKVELTTIQSDKKEEDKELHEELEKLIKERADQALLISKPQLSKYDKIRTYRQNIAIVTVKDEVCNGCYMHLPPQLYVDVKRGDALHACPYCQRILYFEQSNDSGENS